MTKTRKRSKPTEGTPQSLLTFLNTTSNDIKGILDNPATKRKKDVQSGKFLHKTLKNNHKSCSELRYRPYVKASKASEQPHDSGTYMNDSVRALFSDIDRYTAIANQEQMQRQQQNGNMTHSHPPPPYHQHNTNINTDSMSYLDQLLSYPGEPCADSRFCTTYSEGIMVASDLQLQVDHHTTELDVSDFDGLLSYLSDDSPDSSDLEPDYTLFQSF